jgi:small-conductance mechanosensitive channel
LGLGLALCLLAANAAVGQEAAAPAEPEAPAPVVAIAASQIASEADRVKRAIRAFDQASEPGPAVAGIATRLPALAAEIDEQEAQSPDWEATAALGTLSSAASAWQALRLELPRWLTALTDQLIETREALAELDRLAEEWDVTAERLRAEAAPGALVELAVGARRELAAARRRIVERRAELLTLQAEVVEQGARIERALEAIALARESLVGRIFERNAPPLWDPALVAGVEGGLGARVGAGVASERDRLAAFARQNGAEISAHAVLLLVLIVALRSARRRVQQRTEEERGLARVAEVFEAPFSVALLLAIGASFWIYPYLPPVLVHLLGSVATVPAVLLLRRFIDRAFAPLLNALIVFYLLDRVRDLVAALPELVRAIFVVEMLAAVLLIGWLSRPARLRDLPTYANRGTLYLLGLLSRAAWFVMLGALAAEALGYSRLGQLVGGAVLESAYIGVVLYAAVRIFDSLATFALRVRPLGLLGMVQRRRFVMGQRLRRAAVIVAALVWAVEALDLFGIRRPIFATVVGVLTAELEVGNIVVSLADVLAFGITIWLSFVISRFVRFALEEDVFPRLQLARGIPYAASTFTHYTILTLGFFIAVAATGMDLNRFALLAGAFGVGIGFGLQNVVNNFVSGLILLTERPVQVGDTIETADGSLGEVKRIGIRSSTVRTWTGAELIVPNSMLISDPVTNWTLSDKLRRVEVPVGVAYGTDVEAVLQILREVAAGHEDVIDDPEPRPLFRGFGDSSLDFELRIWTGAFDEFARVHSDLNVAINRRLAEAGIEIPFPQRDLHVRSVDELAGQRLGGGEEPGGA